MRLNWNEVAGYSLIVGASCFFGGSASLGKAVMRGGISTIMLMEIRSVVTALTMLILLLLFARSHLKISKNDWVEMLLLGIPGLALVNGSYYYAVKTLPIAIAVFIQFLAPVMIFLYGLLTERENATSAKTVALFLCIAGTYLMVQLNVNSAGPLPVPGIFSAVISMLSYAFYILLSHRLGEKHSSWTILFYGYAIAAVFWCLIQNPAVTASQLTRLRIWGEALLFCLISTLVPFSLFLGGLRRVTPTGASIASTSESVFATLFAFLTLGERLAPGQILGATLILSAVLLLIHQSRSIPTLEEV